MREDCCEEDIVVVGWLVGVVGVGGVVVVTGVHK